MKEYEKEQYEKKIKMKDQNLQSLESQLEIYKKSQIKLKQQLKEKAAMGGANGGKVNSAIKDPKKGKSTGCCGADGPCSIM